LSVSALKKGVESAYTMGCIWRYLRTDFLPRRPVYGALSELLARPKK